MVHVSQEKKKIVDYMLCTASTNVPIQSEQQREEWKTLLAVMHVMNPGAAPYMKRRKTGAFNDVVCHAFGGRQTKPVEQEQIAYFLPYTHVWGSVIALMNKSGVIPMEMNPSVLGFLDWVFFYVKEHMRGAFEINVEESFKRIKVCFAWSLLLKLLSKPVPAGRTATRRARWRRPCGRRSS